MDEQIKYIEYDFEVTPPKPGTDVLIAQLGEIGFESFMETETGVLAYIQEAEVDIKLIEGIDILDADYCYIDYKSKTIKQVNWNEEWENNFSPIVVDSRCCVRAPFHEPSNLPFEIVIEPKMSFGTGHHETTYMMMQFLLDLNLKGKTVLDMGCGTAVLAILAELRGAKSVDAIDIDQWCFLNSKENVDRNNAKNVSVFQGDASLIVDKVYNVIIANINRNILLKDIESYTKCLTKNGILLLSGFYKEDIKIIEDECNAHMLNLSERLEKNNWVCLKFIN